MLFLLILLGNAGMIKTMQCVKFFNPAVRQKNGRLDALRQNERRNLLSIIEKAERRVETARCRKLVNQW